MPQVITRFHNLRRIDMMGCYMVTAPVIEKFCAAKVVFKRMESINMEALPELKDKAVSKAIHNAMEKSRKNRGKKVRFRQSGFRGSEPDRACMQTD